MDKKMKVIIVLCIVISLLIGYIIGGGSKCNAVGGEEAILTMIYSFIENQIMKYLEDEIKSYNDRSIMNQKAQLKLAAAATGNEDLLNLANDPLKVISMTSGDWVKLIKNKLSDVVPGLIGKLSIKRRKGNPQEEKEWKATVDAIGGTSTNENGIVSDLHRYAVLKSINDNAFNEVVQTYDIPVVIGGKITNNKSQDETGSLTEFIKNRNDLYDKYEKALGKHGDQTPLQVQLQLLNQLTLFQASINLKLLEAQATANRVSTLRDFVDLSDKIRENNKALYGR